jgi:hypothetical protein
MGSNENAYYCPRRLATGKNAMKNKKWQTQPIGTVPNRNKFLWFKRLKHSFIVVRSEICLYCTQMRSITKATISIRTFESIGSTDFEITATGEIKVKSTLDFMTTSSYSLIVVASDGTNTGTATVTINVKTGRYFLFASIKIHSTQKQAESDLHDASIFIKLTQ